MSGAAVPQPIVPPFTLETARAKVKAAQDLWNTRDPEKVALAYTPDTIWRNRDSFMRGHDEVKAFLRSKWERERGYRLRKELFSFTENRIAVQFFYEWYEVKADGAKQWHRTYGLEDWTFEPEDNGRMRKRMMSGNDIDITDEERWFKEGVDVDSVVISEKHL